MPFVQWKPGFSVGDPAIDEQHSGLLDIINRMHQVMLAGGKSTEIQSVLEELMHYTLRHFAYEEEMLERCGYPELDEHKRKHLAMMIQLQELREEAVHAGATVPLKMMVFLQDWLAKHILGTDLRYSSYLAARRVA